MAEFVQTMKDWQRMCNDCKTTCNLFDGLCKAIPEMSIQDLSDSDISEIEKAVVAWAAKHPVVYPTWGKWLQEIGVAEVGSGMLSIHPAIAEQPIPADIAQKLGIEPKVNV